MKRFMWITVAAAVVAAPIVVVTTKTQAAPNTVPFKAATLIVETNATDGDAGLQVKLDHEPWRSISIRRPDGKKILDVQNRGVLRDYGLTELFSESSEPPFEQFPFAKFRKLFPEGNYTFQGTTIEGARMQSLVPLTHNIPDGPQIIAPAEGATVSPGSLLVEWTPVTTPAGIEIKGYQVVVVGDEPQRVLEATLPPDATSMTIPAEFLSSGEYKVEVLAIEIGGNQTLTEATFTVA